MNTKNKSSDGLKAYYFSLKKFILNSVVFMVPYFRRLLRFLALPYCYFKIVNWEECNASRYHVFKDLLYIFFTLKYFPDNYSKCRLWEKDRNQWHFYYGSIYDPYQRARLRKEVQPKEYEILFEDKYVCYQLCMAAGLPLPKLYTYITPYDNFKATISGILRKEPTIKLIIKPLLGKGGLGIVTAFISSGNLIVKNNERDFPPDDFVLSTPAVIQQYIQQHEKLDQMSPSINTIRTVTLLTKSGEIILVGAAMRFGVGDSLFDNMCLGGVGVGINITEGTLKKYAYDFSSRVYLKHPTSDILFEGFHVPHWNAIVDLAKKIQASFSYYKLLGYDIAVTPDGPVVIEINAAHDNVWLEQSYGPILADKKVREEFDKYNLLINKASRT